MTGWCEAANVVTFASIRTPLKVHPSSRASLGMADASVAQLLPSPVLPSPGSYGYIHLPRRFPNKFSACNSLPQNLFPGNPTWGKLPHKDFNLQSTRWKKEAREKFCSSLLTPETGQLKITSSEVERYERSLNKEDTTESTVGPKILFTSYFSSFLEEYGL